MSIAEPILHAPSPPENATVAIKRPGPASPGLSRRRFLRRALALGALPLSVGAYATQVEPFWLDVHERDIQIPGLPASFDGFRIVHLTDLHAGDRDGAPMDYLARVVRWIAPLRPDCVAVTGDLVNHTANTIEPVADLLSTIEAPVLVSFGNHDYCPYSARPNAWTILADPLQAALESRGCTVLRNRAVALTRTNDRERPDGRGLGTERGQERDSTGAAERLWFVGLEDLYTTRFSPQVAFRGVDPNETVVALSHNPDSCKWLQNTGSNLILSGHTHGGQVRIPLLGAPVLPLLNRRFEQGLFQLRPDCQMYVSRGVGYLWQARLFCRPELPCLVLRCSR